MCHSEYSDEGDCFAYHLNVFDQQERSLATLTRLVVNPEAALADGISLTDGLRTARSGLKSQSVWLIEPLLDAYQGRFILEVFQVIKLSIHHVLRQHL